MSIVMNLAPFLDMTLLKRILENQHIGCERGYFERLVYLLSADCESCPVLFFFLRSHAADELSVCHVFFAIFWNVFPSNEFDCVGWILYASVESIC